MDRGRRNRSIPEGRWPGRIPTKPAQPRPIRFDHRRRQAEDLAARPVSLPARLCDHKAWLFSQPPYIDTHYVYLIGVIARSLTSANSREARCQLRVPEARYRLGGEARPRMENDYAATTQRRIVCTAERPGSSDFRIKVRSWNQRSSSASSRNVRTAPAEKSPTVIEACAARSAIFATSSGSSVDKTLEITSGRSSAAIKSPSISCLRPVEFVALASF